MSHAFLAYAIAAAQVLLLLAMGFSVVRMARGPRAQDRALALDTFYVALLGFASTMAVSKFLMRGEVIE